MIQLTYRQRWLVIGLTVFVTAWILFVLGIKPTLERIETLNRVVPENRKILENLRMKSKQYFDLQTILDDCKKGATIEEKEFELLAFMESITAELLLTKKVATMKQDVLQLDSNHREVIVEVKLESITFKQLIQFLLKIKSSNHFLRIRSLYTNKNTINSGLLDTTIQISTLMLKGAK